MFLEALGIDPHDTAAIRRLAKSSGVKASRLSYYQTAGILPSPREQQALCAATGITSDELRLRMGLIDRRLARALQANATLVMDAIRGDLTAKLGKTRNSPPVFKTNFGKLYKCDCVEIMRSLPDESVDVIFADPPFNLNKLYPSEIDDNLRTEHYLEWCEAWLAESVRLLRDGGSLFVWNLPRWNSHLSAYLNGLLTFRHWIAVDVKYSLPISGRLYPSHYSLLYYCKGEKPKAFHPDRLPMKVCPKCMADLTDYGGYKDKMNPCGVSLTDVWLDIPPVRHAKYKKRKDANELPLRLMDRIIEMSSNEGDVILDPFGGSGTTYVAAELKNRKWIGIEIGPADDIKRRFDAIQEERDYLRGIRGGYNKLFLEDIEKRRRQQGLWTCGHIPKKSPRRKAATSADDSNDLAMTLTFQSDRNA